MINAEQSQRNTELLQSLLSGKLSASLWAIGKVLALKTLELQERVEALERRGPRLPDLPTGQAGGQA